MRGEILVRRITPRRTSKGTRPSATVGYLRPRLAALVTQCVPDVFERTSETVGQSNQFLCHKIKSPDQPLTGRVIRARLDEL